MEPLPVFRLGRILAGLGMAACLAFTQTPQPDNAAPTVVTVTAQGMPVSEVPASVTVLSRDYIESSHADNAADLLRAAPFLQIAQTGAGGGLTTVSIRGAQSNFTLVMIDGIPVNDSTNLLGGAFDLTTLPVSNIEQVEIVRGPLSSIYGSDAIGGVINFISRKGAKKSLIEAS
ncbi:MAG TPA: TonB-dependent receptor plug domain-containing protein, partial [Bryobacteraceae bacterium]